MNNADERAAIVAWIREKADTYLNTVRIAFPPHIITPQLAANTGARWAELHFVADAIERGEHLNQGKQKADD